VIDSCLTCMYYRGGHCRRHPPRIVEGTTYQTIYVPSSPDRPGYSYSAPSGSYQRTVWPTVGGMDWCAEWEQVGAPKPKPLQRVIDVGTPS
jgi:hypothetical protein